jgi:hypothetical protein
MSALLTSIVETIKNNTIGAGEIVRQFWLVLMLMGWVDLTEAQYIGVMQFFSAVLAFIAIKTTIATNKIDQRVDEKVAHREMTGTTRTGTRLATAPQPDADHTSRSPTCVCATSTPSSFTAPGVTQRFEKDGRSAGVKGRIEF